jgi:Ser/Thr protein kinase RdoA (MazF antagonist)
MPDQAPFFDLAKQATVAYDIDDCDLTFIRHSDSVTYKVETPDTETYLLRLHVPIVSAMGTHGADPRAVQSELVWLEALNQDTDLFLQQPVRNRDGDLVTQVAHEHKIGPVNCSLLCWVEGESYHRALESEQTARQIGEILARLHLHASGWTIPDGFQRPCRGVAYFERVLEAIYPACQDGRIAAADFETFEQSIASLTETLHSLETNRQSDGIMHADAHKGNMLYHDGQIRLIDFSFCAFGNYMFDLGICLSDMKEHLHSIFLESYQRLHPLPDGYQRLVEGFFVGSMVGTFSYWVHNPHTQEILVRKAPQIAKNYAAKFNRGEYFWFSQKA